MQIVSDKQLALIKKKTANTSSVHLRYCSFRCHNNSAHGLISDNSTTPREGKVGWSEEVDLRKSAALCWKRCKRVKLTENIFLNWII